MVGLSDISLYLGCSDLSLLPQCNYYVHLLSSLKISASPVISSSPDDTHHPQMMELGPMEKRRIMEHHITC